MKKLLALALVAVMAVGASAQIIFPPDTETDMMGLFFASPWVDANTNTNVIGSGIPMYVVLLNATEGTRGYEGQFRGADGLVIGTNFYLLALSHDPAVGALRLGEGGNFLVGFANVLPYNPDGMVLGTWTVMFFAGGSIEFGPAQPTSVPEDPRPAILGEDPTDLKAANWTVETHGEGHTHPWYKVATVMGGGVVATEESSLTGVKALFK
jgi:hypothetical protein